MRRKITLDELQEEEEEEVEEEERGGGGGGGGGEGGGGRGGEGGEKRKKTQQKGSIPKTNTHKIEVSCADNRCKKSLWPYFCHIFASVLRKNQVRTNQPK